MPRIDPSRQDSMSESILRFYHNQNWAKIEFLYEFGRKSTKFHVFQINLIIRFVGCSLDKAMGSSIQAAEVVKA